MQNYCDGSGPHTDGAVKVLSIGGSGNAILCHSCWNRELDYRRERNNFAFSFSMRLVASTRITLRARGVVGYCTWGAFSFKEHTGARLRV